MRVHARPDGIPDLGDETGVEDAVGGKPDPSLTPGWVQEMVDEWASFPNGAHDDNVDAFTQMVIRTQQSGRLGLVHVESL